MKLFKKILKILGIALLCIALAWSGIALLPRPQNFPMDNPMLKDGDMPILIAHGGGNKEFPDNTLEAFYNAYSVDPRVMMETDVSITKDGVVILSHDTTLDRKTNVTGNIIDWNYADLMAQKVDFGYTNKTKSQQLVAGSERVKFTTLDGKHVTPLDVSYPEGVSPRDESVFLATTLEELIVSFPDNAINVEIKQEGATGMACMRAVLALLEKHDAWDRVVLASFHDDIYNEYVRMQAADEVPDAFMYSPSTGGATKPAGPGCVLPGRHVRFPAAHRGDRHQPGHRVSGRYGPQAQPGRALLDHQRCGRDEAAHRHRRGRHHDRLSPPAGGGLRFLRQIRVTSKETGPRLSFEKGRRPFSPPEQRTDGFCPKPSLGDPLDPSFVLPLGGS